MALLEMLPHLLAQIRLISLRSHAVIHSLVLRLALRHAGVKSDAAAGLGWVGRVSVRDAVDADWLFCWGGVGIAH